MPSPDHRTCRRLGSTRRRGAIAAVALTTAVFVAACAPPSPYGRGDNPSGSVDSVVLGTDSVTVSGWAADRNASGPIDVVFWVDGKLRPERATASGNRPDVAALTGSADRGYSVTLAVAGASTSTLVCVSGLNVGRGASALLGCRPATTAPPAHEPPDAAPPTTTPPTTTPPSTTVPPPPPWLGLGETVRVSVSSDAIQGNDGSDRQSISADGRYVAFTSGASNLVPGDTNGRRDVFVRDNVAGTTARVSVAADGSQADADSYYTAISGDGRYVAFASDASNLVPDDTNGRIDVFVRDIAAGTTARVSVGSDGSQADGHSEWPQISGDGRYVAFFSGASNLVPDDTNWKADVFVHDNVTGSTTRVSVGSDGTQGDADSDRPSISSDGRYVAFSSNASNLVPGDTNGSTDVFVRDVVAATTTRVSVNSDGSQAEGNSRQPSISSDGRYVAFSSSASNLVVGDTNWAPDVFVHRIG